jgi:hypothetical protein
MTAFELIKIIGKTKTSKSSIPVLFASFWKPVLQNQRLPKVFRISGQLFCWPSGAPMQLGAWRRAAIAFRVSH